FFFSSRRRHTRSKRDWSSDVCSSDLACARRALGDRELAEAGQADLVAARQLVGDLPERRLDRLFGLAVAQTGLLGDRACELGLRSEERRVGKEWRSRWAPGPCNR